MFLYGTSIAYYYTKGDMMITNISINNIQVQGNIKNVIQRKLNELSKNLHQSSKIEWICENENGLNKCRALVILPLDIIETESTNISIYKSIDHVIEKIRNKLRYTINDNIRIREYLKYASAQSKISMQYAY